MKHTAVIKLLKLLTTGVIATVLGVAQLATGDQQGIVGGIGSLVVAVVVFGFIAYILLPRKEKAPNAEAELRPGAKNPSGLLWLGMLLTLAPGLLYLYLHYAMYRFSLGAVAFLGIPILIGGLACIGAGLLPMVKKGKG